MTRCPILPGPMPILLVMSRLPVPGEVKTRLHPTLGPAGALRLHEALLADTLEMADRVARRCGAGLVMAFSGSGRPATAWRHRYPDLHLLRQQGDDLGERLLGAHRSLLSERGARVLTVGSDSPTLPETILIAGWNRLLQDDVVLAPADDGGYTVLGVGHPRPELFRGIPWGTSGVLEATRNRADQSGLSVSLLPGWFDVDDAVGLRRLSDDLARTPESAPRCATVLRALLPRR